MNPSEPKRYGLIFDDDKPEVDERSDGEYILHSDHQRIVAALEARERKLREAVQKAVRHIRHDAEPGNVAADTLLTELRAALAGKEAQV